MKNKIHMTQKHCWGAVVGVLMATLIVGWPGAQAQEIFQLSRHIPVPQDKEYVGPIQIKVDARNVDQKIFQVQQKIPVQPGKLVMFFPKWLPGNHRPSGPITQLGGLVFTGNGQVIPWKRDPLEVYAFHLDIPDGVRTITAEYQFLSPTDPTQPGRNVVTDTILNLQWTSLAMYPAGYYGRRLTYEASVVLPDQWKFGTALRVASQRGNHVTFQPTDFDTLIDSPLFAGLHFNRIDLDPGKTPSVHLNLFGDAAEHVEVKPEIVDVHRNLVQQAYKLFGAQHYKHYDFLFALSDELSKIGLEHHQSSENKREATHYTKWKKEGADKTLLPHEFVHSWNGKFRRPVNLFTVTLDQPMQNNLLWVYEGQTQYWGEVLAARSGINGAKQTKEALAVTAASFDTRTGRAWRSLEDTTYDPIINYRQTRAWHSWSRSEDYYSEGALIWLDADTKIRELSGDTKSLNDFAKAFFGIENGKVTPTTYTFEDVVAVLQSIQPYDWAEFLRERVDGVKAHAPLDGLARSGWRLVYDEKPSDFIKAHEEKSESHNFQYSLGFSVNKSGKLEDIKWGGVAFKEGLSMEMSLVAVNGKTYKPDALKAAISAAKGAGKAPIELLLKKGNRYITKRIAYHDGLRYPNLVRIEGTRDRLSEIFSPL